MPFSQFSYLYDLYNLRRNLRLSRLELEKLQERKLRTLLRYTYNKVGYYKRLFDKAGITPQDIQTLQDLSKLPITDKNDLQVLPKEEITAKDIDPLCLFNIRTSGSTGAPLDIFVSRQELMLRWAFYRRMYLRNGAKLSDKELAISTRSNFSHRNWFEKFGILRRKCISVSCDTEKQLKAILEFNPNIIGGYTYSSALKNLAVEIKERQIRSIKPRIIFSTAELLTKQDRAFISEAFQCELFNFYSCNECGIIAWECNKHSGYHINSDNVIVEFIKEGTTPVGYGEEGDVIITSLNSYAMPFIRYRLQDVAIPLEKECQCGINFPMVKIVTGRTNDYFAMPDGRKISPFTITETIERVPGVCRYQALQQGLNEVRIDIVKDKKGASDIINNVRGNAKELFGDAIKVEVNIVQELSSNNISGKFQAVKSQSK